MKKKSFVQQLVETVVLICEVVQFVNGKQESKQKKENKKR